MEDMEIRGPLLAKQFNSMRSDMYAFISSFIQTKLIIASDRCRPSTICEY